MNRRLLLTLLGFAMWSIGVASPAAHASDLVADLDQFIQRAQVEWGVPGVAVAVVQDDRVLLLKGYGVRRLGEPGSVDENTIFQLASNSKTFTAAALGVLVDEQKVGWDDLVISRLPEFIVQDPYPTRYMTVRDLLAHRTGLPAFGGDLLNPLGYTRAEILARLPELAPAYSLREVAQYSNVAFMVAGEVAGRVDGTSWERVVQSRLLDPLGMSRSGTSFANLSRDANVAANHAGVGGVTRVIPPSNSDTLGAAGSVSSTAADMARWLRMLLADGSLDGRRILRPTTIQQMFAPSMVAEPGFTELPPISAETGFFYGLGWDSFHYGGPWVIEKAGALDGVRTVVTLVPAKKLGIAVLANLNITVLPEAVRAYFLDRSLGLPDDAIQTGIRERAAALQALLTSPSPPKDAAPPSRPLAEFAGSYENPLYGRFSVVLENGALVVEGGPARYRAKLDHWSYDTFLLSWPSVNLLPEQLTFTIGADGKAAGFDSESLGHFVRAPSGA
jgi:CubicO group peptidase (beta-lactamase class C family)